MRFPHVRYSKLTPYIRFIHNRTGLKYVMQVLENTLRLQYNKSSSVSVKYNCAEKCGADQHKGARLVTHVAEETFKRKFKRATLIFGMCILGVSLSGCGASNTLSNIGLAINGSSSSQESAQPVAQPVAVTKPPIAFAQVFGPPVNVAQKLSGALESEAQVRSIPVVKAKSVPNGYTVRGYLSAAPDKNGTKLLYVWDVTNSAGKRAHRIKGEEIVSGPKNTNDPWSGVDQSAIQTIASKTATKLANWLPANNSQNLLQNAALQTPAKPTYSGPVVAFIPSVKGAPGDGNQALAAALKTQLTNRNINVASSASSQKTYKVVGLVNLTAPSDGKQSIRIQWIVKDPNDKRLGTVSQKNSIPSGSLDGKWGKTADAAASAAAQGVAKLLKN